MTLIIALIARLLFDIQWVKNVLLSILFFIFATFQIVMLSSAYTSKSYVEQAYTLIDTSKDYVDVDALTALLPNIKDYIPEDYLPEDVKEITDDTFDKILDSSATAAEITNTAGEIKDTAVSTSLGLINAVKACINAYITRRWLWLAGEVALFFVLAGLMRRRKPKYSSADADLFAGF